MLGVLNANALFTIGASSEEIIAAEPNSYETAPYSQAAIAGCQIILAFPSLRNNFLAQDLSSLSEMRNSLRPAPLNQELWPEVVFFSL